MAVAHLVVVADDARVALVNDCLPTVATTELFTAGEALGLPLVIVRTLDRLGDDRVMLAECVGPPDSGRVEWASSQRAQACNVAFADAIRAAEAPADDTDRPAWMNRGWMRHTLAWIAAHHGPVTRVHQLKHWALSAVTRVVTERGDVVVKQVPATLGAEGPVTALLAELAPGVVPRVLTVDDDRFLMQTFTADEGTIEPDGLAALASLQQTTIAHTDRLIAAGCRVQTSTKLATDLAALLDREDLLFERDWELSTTDGRRPPRQLGPRDVTRLRALLDRVAADADRLHHSAPPTIVHGDFHPLNVARVAGRSLILDWGTAFLGDPRADLPTWCQLASTDVGVDSFLATWNMPAADWDQLRYAMYLMNALTCATLADAVADRSARKDWSAAVQKRLLEALDLIDQ